MHQTDGSEMWEGIQELLRRSSWRLAYGREPWAVFATGRDDVAELEQPLEDQFARETDEFIRQFIRTMDFPQRSRNIVRFYAGQRLDWASKFLRVLLTPTGQGRAPFLPPAVEPVELLEWLLISAYHSRCPASKSLLRAV